MISFKNKLPKSKAPELDKTVKTLLFSFKSLKMLLFDQ